MQPTWRNVHEDHTEMFFATKSAAKGFTSILINKRISFHLDLSAEGGYLFTVEEENERGGLAGMWVD